MQIWLPESSESMYGTHVSYIMYGAIHAVYGQVVAVVKFGRKMQTEPVPALSSLFDLFRGDSRPWEILSFRFLFCVFSYIASAYCTA